MDDNGSSEKSVKIATAQLYRGIKTPEPCLLMEYECSIDSPIENFILIKMKMHCNVKNTLGRPSCTAYTFFNLLFDDFPCAVEKF